MCSHTQKAAFNENPSKIFNSFFQNMVLTVCLFGQDQKGTIHYSFSRFLPYKFSRASVSKFWILLMASMLQMRNNTYIVYAVNKNFYSVNNTVVICLCATSLGFSPLSGPNIRCAGVISKIRYANNNTLYSLI
jgi:hypothetical protein